MYDGPEGAIEGVSLGAKVGSWLGADGILVEIWVGLSLGRKLGSVVWLDDGKALGINMGSSVGASVGASVTRVGE